MKRTTKVLSALTAAALLLLQGMPLPAAHAASHREAPLIANDPTADITDFYMFKSWQDSSKVVFIMNVIPGQEPSSGPNYFNFGDDVAYRINVDTNADGKAEDVVYEIRFTTEIRGVTAALELPVANAAVPPVTALDGTGSEGLGVRQSYRVTEIRNGSSRTNLGTGTMFAVPSNMGPATMPDYEALAAKGIYGLSNGGRIFAGQRDETFYIDLGAVFDTINLRTPAPLLGPTEDADDTKNFGGIDHFSGFNVNSIAIEVPISSLTNNSNAVLGAYASTNRNRQTLRREAPPKAEIDRGDLLRGVGRMVQVQRLANPLVNEVIIGTTQKDLWNATEPEDEANFLGFYQNPRLTTVLNLLFATSFPDSGRDDLTNVLLKYPNQTQNGTCSKANPCSELLRLNLAVSPTSPASQKRLTVLAGDSAGWPNGRRPNDDVTDVALRVVAGLLVLSPGSVPNLGDGVNFNIGAPGAGTSDGPGYGSVIGNKLDVTANGIAGEFPFLPTPHDGRDRRHIDCGSPTGSPCTEP